MAELSEDRMYRNYVFHPIWKNKKQITELFKFKDFNCRFLSEVGKKGDLAHQMLEALISKDTILFVQVADDKRKMSSILSSFESFQSLITQMREIAFVEDGYKTYQSVIQITTSDNRRTGYIMLSEDVGRIKYLYSILSDKLSKMNPLSIAKRIDGLDTDTVALMPVITELVDKVIQKKRLSIQGVNAFLTGYEQETENTDIVPKSVVAYYVLRNSLPSGWKIALDFPRSMLYLRFDLPVIVRNAYVRDKITPLKVPMWLDKIYITIPPNDSISIDGTGWHNDLSGRGINEHSELCTGDIKKSRLIQAIHDKNSEEIYNFLQSLTTAMSVTNLDHPHWQFAAVADGILAEIQVIGEEGEEEMVITRTGEPVAPIVLDPIVEALREELRRDGLADDN